MVAVGVLASGRAPAPAGPPLRGRPRPATSLDGTWEFRPGPACSGEPFGTLEVPGLWEAQGHLDLDGVATYRRTVLVPDEPFLTLRFGAVMDAAAVHLDGVLLGRHDLPYTPFELDLSGVAPGPHELVVEVTDHVLRTPEHERSPHGKQGWANQDFPSPPSLYMTYGGIWQPVELRSHGPVVLRDLWADGDPADLTVEAELHNVDAVTRVVRLQVEVPGARREREVRLRCGERRVERFALEGLGLPGWSPRDPVLHDLRASVVVLDAERLLGGAAERPSDTAATRFGVRRVRVAGEHIEVDGVPWRMRSVLVQGFRADTLYAEGDRASIEAEVRAAKDLGFTAVRLHLKAFDPRYLDVCDELGVYVHCDLPVAEPIDHEALDGTGELAEACRAAVVAQVRRDRGHPSIVMWSAMNEIGHDGSDIRPTDAYERFARFLHDAVVSTDHTRPVIENDWTDPDPARVFCSPILTAHWYGRLDEAYLDELEAKATRWSGTGRPLLVTELGDWGLPDMEHRPDPPFWWYGDHYEREVAATPYPAGLAELCRGTQRYLGLADRLQIELLRRHASVGGFCLTELTDVPWELNGLLDLERRPKALAVEELRRANADVLPMLAVDRLDVLAGGEVTGTAWVANDGDALPAGELVLRLGRSWARRPVAPLPAHGPTRLGRIGLAAPEAPGPCTLTVELHVGGDVVGRNEYPVLVVPRPDPGAGASAPGVLVIEEGALDAHRGRTLAEHLADGGRALVLAQQPQAAAHYPVPVTLRPVTTEWGGTDFHFTTDVPALPFLPPRQVLATEDLGLRPTALITGIEGTPWATTTAVGLYKPLPLPNQGTVVGSLDVGPGRLVVCQYSLARAERRGHPLASAARRALVAWAAAGAPAT